MTEPRPLSDAEARDLLALALSAIGTDAAGTVHADSALVSARMALIMLIAALENATAEAETPETAIPRPQTER